MEKLWAKDTEGVASASQSIKMPLFRDPLVGQWCRTEILSSSRQPGWRDLPTAFPVNTEMCYKSHSSAYASWLLITRPVVGWCYFQPCSVHNHPSSTEIFFLQGTNLPFPLCSPTITSHNIQCTYPKARRAGYPLDWATKCFSVG